MSISGPNAVEGVAKMALFLPEVRKMPEMAFDMQIFDRMQQGDPNKSYDWLVGQIEAMIERQRLEKHTKEMADGLARVGGALAACGNSDADGAETATKAAKDAEAQAERAEKAQRAAEALLGSISRNSQNSSRHHSPRGRSQQGSQRGSNRPSPKRSLSPGGRRKTPGGGRLSPGGRRYPKSPGRTPTGSGRGTPTGILSPSVENRQRNLGCVSTISRIDVNARQEHRMAIANTSTSIRLDSNLCPSRTRCQLPVPLLLAKRVTSPRSLAGTETGVSITKRENASSGMHQVRLRFAYLGPL